MNLLSKRKAVRSFVAGLTTEQRLQLLQIIGESSSPQQQRQQVVGLVAGDEKIILLAKELFSKSWKEYAGDLVYKILLSWKLERDEKIKKLCDLPKLQRIAIMESICYSWKRERLSAQIKKDLRQIDDDDLVFYNLTKKKGQK